MGGRVWGAINSLCTHVSCGGDKADELRHCGLVVQEWDPVESRLESSITDPHDSDSAGRIVTEQIRGSTIELGTGSQAKREHRHRGRNIEYTTQMDRCRSH